MYDSYSRSCEYGSLKLVFEPKQGQVDLKTNTIIRHKWVTWSDHNHVVYLDRHTCTPVSLTSIDHLGCFKSFLLFICWNANDFQNAWGILCIISDSSRSFIVLFVQIGGQEVRTVMIRCINFCPVRRSFSLGVFSLWVSVWVSYGSWFIESVSRAEMGPLF